LSGTSSSGAIMGPTGISIQRESLSSASAVKLIQSLNAELSRTYPEDGATHFRLESEEVEAGQGAFLVAYDGAEPVACGAVRRIDPGTAEIKRMYVRPGFRGLGLGRKMLEALEAEARRLAVTRIVLETGVRQIEALGLYSQTGFARIPAFGEYLNSPLSICMGKDL